MMAALASAAMPGVVVAGVRESEQINATDRDMAIEQAVVQDATGRIYDIFAADTEAGKRRLGERVRAANTLAKAKEPGGLGFAMDRVLSYEDGSNPHGSTGTTAVMVAVHHDGRSRPLNLLTLDDCASVGTTIGAIHRLRPNFLQEQHYPVFTTGKIRSQLIAWIKRLRQAGHIPSSITASWSQILETEGLWSFTSCMVHGGFTEGDFLFSGSTITTVTNWQDMQVNDPARDLAWTFAKLDDTHRNAVLTAYGRMMGSRLDDLIMLRANLWLQMEQVGDFIQALNSANTTEIMQFKAQVERLAHQLALATQTAHTRQPERAPGNSSNASRSRPPSTITVGTLLNDTQRRHAAQQAQQEAEAERAHSRASGVGDETGETDRTGSSPITDVPAESYSSASSSATIAIGTTPSPAREQADITDERDSTAEHDSPAERDSTAQSRRLSEPGSETIIIPLLEREERALRDAREGLESSPETPGRSPYQQNADDRVSDHRETDGHGTPKA